MTFLLFRTACHKQVEKTSPASILFTLTDALLLKKERRSGKSPSRHTGRKMPFTRFWAGTQELSLRKTLQTGLFHHEGHPPEGSPGKKRPQTPFREAPSGKGVSFPAPL